MIGAVVMPFAPLRCAIYYWYGQKMFEFFFNHSPIQAYRVAVAPASLPATYAAGRG